MRAAKVQASLRIRAVSPEPPLLAHTSSESRGTFRQKARSLASLNGWACAVKTCHLHPCNLKVRDNLSPVKRICVFEHSVMTSFNCACPDIQRGQGSGFLSEGSSRLTACMSEQRRFKKISLTVFMSSTGMILSQNCFLQSSKENN